MISILSASDTFDSNYDTQNSLGIRLEVTLLIQKIKKIQLI